MPFNGLATYDNFEGIGEDVSDLVAFLAPFETPLLDAVGMSDQPATNVKHECPTKIGSPRRIVMHERHSAPREGMQGSTA